MLEEGKPFSLALIDLDNFKTINDTIGHAAGDGVLTTLAEQLRKITRSLDMVARYGGDELCFIGAGLTPEQLTNRIAAAVAKRHVRLQIDERILSVLLSTSVGIAASIPGDTPESLMARADCALRVAKQEGKGCIRVAAG
jgi:diguanylate cyclase (GGDEF)-like protein